jgi:hypothetical protein
MKFRLMIKTIIRKVVLPRTIFLWNPLTISLSKTYTSDQKWSNGGVHPNTLKKYISKSMYIGWCYSIDICLYNNLDAETFLCSLMRYSILDTTSSSATEARNLFKKHWDDIIRTLKGFLTSSPPLAPEFVSTLVDWSRHRTRWTSRRSKAIYKSYLD